MENMDNKEMMNESESTPMDDILSTLNEWEKNPKKVTSESISSLKQQLMDLKSIVDSEEESEPYNEDGENNMGKKGEDGSGLLITIGRAMKKHG